MAERNLCEKLGEQGYDDLFADINPAPVVGYVEVTAESETELKRGTLLNIEGGVFGSAESDSEMPGGVVCEDVTIAANATANVAVYKCGTFNGNALICEADLSNPQPLLDLAGIYIKFAQESDEIPGVGYGGFSGNVGRIGGTTGPVRPGTNNN